MNQELELIMHIKGKMYENSDGGKDQKYIFCIKFFLS